MADTVEKCPTCGSTAIRFDPPVGIEIVAACGQAKPGTYAANPPGGIPVCDLPTGHDGAHSALIEYNDTWAQGDRDA